jgi:hypothetical protein
MSIESIGTIGKSSSFVPIGPHGSSSSCMGKNKEGRGTISGVVDQGIIDLIDKRRALVSLSRSTYLSLIVQNWMDAGGPPVSPAEKTIAELAKINLPPKKRR